MPEETAEAVIRLYFQSVMHEFVDFLRDENRTDTQGEELYALWEENGKCPPTFMTEATWYIAFQLEGVSLTPDGTVQVRFLCRPGTTYTVEFTDELTDDPSWAEFAANGTQTPETPQAVFVDDFTANTSGSRPSSGTRFYRFKFGQGS